MKNTKELESILAALYCLNFCSDNRDKEIEEIIDYAFLRLFDANTNFLALACIGKSREQILEEVRVMLNQTTNLKELGK